MWIRIFEFISSHKIYLLTTEPQSSINQQPHRERSAHLSDLQWQHPLVEIEAWPMGVGRVLQINDFGEKEALFSFMDGLKPWAKLELHRRGVFTITEAMRDANQPGI